jgi:ATP-dependent helicase/nuclease subunit B
MPSPQDQAGPVPTAFLEQVASHLLGARAPEDLMRLSDYHLVLPTRRACLYMKHYLARLAGSTFFAPTILAVDDFIAQITDKVIPDGVTLLFELYESYKQFDHSPDHNLDRFAPLGAAILSDFNLLDKNLVPADELFDYLEEAKAIDRWAEELGQEADALRERLKGSNTITSYYEFWHFLKLTYHHFRRRLLAKGAAYMGLAYRIVEENLAETVRRNGLTKVVFAGFNQLSKSEESIFAQLQQQGLAEIYWDTDRFYIYGDERPTADGSPAPPCQHEAGHYFRRYLQQRLLRPGQTPLTQLGRCLGHQPKHIRLIGCSNKVAQAKLAGDLLATELRQMLAQGTLDEFRRTLNHTAVLLPDESLLLPMLHSLPVLAKETDGIDFALKDYINVTMGLSMDKTPLFNLIDDLFAMQDNFREGEQRETLVYHKDVVKLLRHPYIQYSAYYQAHFDQIQEQLKKINDDNQVYVPLADLWQKGEEIALLAQQAPDQAEGPGGNFYQVLFRAWGGSTEQALQNLYDLTATLHGLFDGENNILESEYLLTLYGLLRRIDAVLGQYKTHLSVRTFRFFLYETIRGAVVPFTGEPLSPVQLMGMLESRALDFRHVIVLSCNEGVLPKGKLNNSVVPFELRLRYGMPTHTENDATFAYTFYRLLHRAERVTLIYTTATSSTMGTSEKSRFLTQIEAELAGHGPTQLTKQQMVLALPESNRALLEVEKTAPILARIREFLQHKLTPSAINQYVRDPLDFFKRYILQLDEPTELEEEMMLRTFGTVIHEFLEKILHKYEGKNLTADLLTNLVAKDAENHELLERIILAHKPGLVTDRGKNFILKQVAAHLLTTFLTKEAGRAPFFLVQQETKMQATLHVPAPSGEPVAVRLEGVADRIDFADDKLRIVDYKTGSFQSQDLKAKTFAELLTDPAKGKVVQLVIYKYLLIKELQEGKLDGNLPGNLWPEHLLADVQNIESGFYFFRKLQSAGLVGYKLEEEAQGDPGKFMAQVEQFIADFVGELLDTSKPFRRPQPEAQEPGTEGETPEPGNDD